MTSFSPCPPNRKAAQIVSARRRAASGTSHRRAQRHRLWALNDWRKCLDWYGGNLRFVFPSPLVSEAHETRPVVFVSVSFGHFPFCKGTRTRPASRSLIKPDFKLLNLSDSLIEAATTESISPSLETISFCSSGFGFNANPLLIRSGEVCLTVVPVASRMTLRRKRSSHQCDKKGWIPIGGSFQSELPDSLVMQNSKCLVEQHGSPKNESHWR